MRARVLCRASQDERPASPMTLEKTCLAMRVAAVCYAGSGTKRHIFYDPSDTVQSVKKQCTYARKMEQKFLAIESLSNDQIEQPERWLGDGVRLSDTEVIAGVVADSDIEIFSAADGGGGKDKVRRLAYVRRAGSPTGSSDEPIQVGSSSLAAAVNEPRHRRRLRGRHDRRAATAEG